VLETPNPDNVIVASRTFFLDPTHRHVLPHAYTEFLLEHVGFRDTEVVPLNPNKEATPLVADPPSTAEAINALLYGPQDYAAMGTK